MFDVMCLNPKLTFQKVCCLHKRTTYLAYELFYGKQFLWSFFLFFLYSSSIVLCTTISLCQEIRFALEKNNN